MFRATRHTLRGAKLWLTPPACHSSRSYTFQTGDRVLIQQANRNTCRLSKPLRSGWTHNVQTGHIEHDAIIGKQPRDVVTIGKADYRLLKPSLEEFIVEAPRIVTPIYPKDANLIVSHLDIHVGPPGSYHELDSPLEIFEAGTGHGGLTLFLARAIHAANPPLPRQASEEADVAKSESENPGPVAAVKPDATATDHIQGPAPFPSSWRARRRAVIHSLDISAEHSRHARNIVRTFGRGIYAGNVDFYVGDITRWIDEQQAERFAQDAKEQTFLSHAILDLPRCHAHLRSVAKALHSDGKLLVFCPSVTQIADCVEIVREQFLPLKMEQVLELGSASTGGREWDVRLVKPRTTSRPVAVVSEEVPADSAEPVVRTDSEAIDSGYGLVCRPSPFVRSLGGGFLGIWTKMKDTRT